MRQVALGLAAFIAVVFVGLLVGVIQVSSTSGPMGFHDGRYHTVVEISVFDQIGYSFGSSRPSESGGWFRPMSWTP